jgi:hypothetical protein
VRLFVRWIFAWEENFSVRRVPCGSEEAANTKDKNGQLKKRGSTWRIARASPWLPILQFKPSYRRNQSNPLSV